ncbi:hypothetical protein [Gordonia sp. (in: high G+C Gram-positive bacteria)]
MPSKSVVAAIVAVLSVAVAVIAVRRVSARGVDPIAPAPPRVTDFTR